MNGLRQGSFKYFYKWVSKGANLVGGSSLDDLGGQFFTSKSLVDTFRLNLFRSKLNNDEDLSFVFRLRTTPLTLSVSRKVLPFTLYLGRDLDDDERSQLEGYLKLSIGPWCYLGLPVDVLSKFKDSSKLGHVAFSIAPAGETVSITNLESTNGTTAKHISAHELSSHFKRIELSHKNTVMPSADIDLKQNLINLKPGDSSVFELPVLIDVRSLFEFIII